MYPERGLWILLCALLTSSNAFYHLLGGSKHEACEVAATANATVDLICQYRDVISSGDPARTCVLQSVTWRRLHIGFREQNITISHKHGIWLTLDGWGVDRNYHVSVMRIRDFRQEDVGTYMCEVHCRHAHSGHHTRVRHYADLDLLVHNSALVLHSNHMLSGPCSVAFWNGRCDPMCDTEGALYDGMDCVENALEDCHPINEQFCSDNYGNGVCEPACETAQCTWDGGDCLAKTLNIAQDILVIHLSPTIYTRQRPVDVRLLSRQLSKLLKTIVRRLTSEHVQELLANSARKHGLSKKVRGTLFPNRIQKTFSGVPRDYYFKIDNTLCEERCFRSAGSAAKYINVALKRDWTSWEPILSASVLREQTKQCAVVNNTMLNIHLGSSPGYSTEDGTGSHSRLGYHQPGMKGNQPQSSGDKGPLGLGFLSNKWVLAAVVLATALTLVLCVVVVVVVCKLRRMSKRRQRGIRVPTSEPLGESDLIRANKNTPTGTQV